MSTEPEAGASWPGLRRIFRLPTSRRRVRAEVSDELSFHIEERIEELMGAGLLREQAEAEVRRRFGDVIRVEHELEEIDGQTRRQRERGESIGSLRRDVRYAVRGMARHPMYSAIIVATLALGIGANTAIFSAVNAVLLRPVPTPALDELVVLRGNVYQHNLLDAEISPGEAVDLMQRRDLFQASTAFRRTSFNFTGLGQPQRVSVVQTTGEFFGVFAIRPVIGTLYGANDSRSGGRRVVALSHALWRDLFGSDPGVVGRTVELDGLPFLVVGVVPQSFRFPYGAELYMPFELTQRVLSPEHRWSMYMTFVGRLAPGVSAARLPSELAAEVTRWGERLGMREQYTATKYGLTVVPFVDFVAGDLRQILFVLIGAVVLVLLIACANIASLQLVRAIARVREVALRIALGAGRRTVARQLLVENVVLALAGAVFGVAIGRALLRLVSEWGAAGHGALEHVALDARALSFTTAVAVLAGLVFGLAPALRAARIDVHDTLKGHGRAATGNIARHRFLRATVVVQIALAVVLLCASALTARSLVRLLSADPGFRASQVMSMRVSLPALRYPSGPARVAFYDRLLTRLQSVPGFVSAGIVAYAPFTGGSDSSPFSIEGIPGIPGQPARHANSQIIAGDYLRTMGIPLLKGRGFERQDGDSRSRVALIDNELARQYFDEGVDPIGKVITHGAGPATIVGVVGAVRQSKLDAPLKATVYHYYPQYSWLSFTTIVVRSALPPSVVTSRVKSVVAELDPFLPMYDAKPMAERIASSIAARRLAIAILAGFAGLSLLLAVLGVYGVISYTTNQRTREMGIRVALGAEPRAVTALVLRSGLLLAAVGAMMGVVGFLGVSGALRALLYGVAPNDPATVASSVVLLLATASLAAYLPARRAARIDPVAALRAE